MDFWLVKVQKRGEKFINGENSVKEESPEIQKQGGKSMSCSPLVPHLYMLDKALYLLIFSDIYI